MRQVGSLKTEQQAERLANYLLAQGIESRVDRSDDGWMVWALDDDHVAKAKEELATFRESPDDAKYDAAQDPAKQIRKEQQATEERARKNMVRVQPSRSPLQADTRPVTIGVLVISLLVFIVTAQGEQMEPTGTMLTINSYEVDGQMIRWMPGLPDIKSGQFWRVVTPIFIHFGPMHLIMNGLMFFQFGSAFEQRLGSWKLVAFVIVTAAASNLAEYGWSSPGFGGLSGVLFALFGFVWMQWRFSPQSGFYMPQRIVYILVGWLFICMTPLLEIIFGIRVANAAHVVGLLSGMAIGFAPAGWKMLRSR